MIKNKTKLPFSLVLGISMVSFFGVQPINAMNETKSIDTDLQKFFKTELKDITHRLDVNLKALIELLFCDLSGERCKSMCKSINDDLNRIVDYMQEDKFNWHPQLITALCNEIKKQLLFNSQTSQFKCQMQVVAAWRMKNHLFELFDQKRIKNYFYLDCFKVNTEIIDNRSLDEILKEYSEYKEKFSGIDRIDQFFKKIDTNIEEFKKSKESLKSELEEAKKDRIPGSITGSLEWNFYNYIFVPIMSSGLFHISDTAKEMENKEILERDMKNQISFFENKIVGLETELKNSLLQALAQFKKETKMFKPLLDEYMLPHKKFLNLMIELASKNCNEIALYDCFDGYNPKKMLNNFMGTNLIKLEKPLKNTQKFLSESQNSLQFLINNMVNGVTDLNNLDDINNFLWAPIFNISISIFERLIESESFSRAMCKVGESLGSEEITQSICEIRQTKKIINRFNLSLRDAKELIKLIGSDRIGILIKAVLRMVANDPKKTKSVLGESLWNLVNAVYNNFNALEKKSREYSTGYFLSAKTKSDDIALLSYLSQVNKTIMKNNNSKEKAIIRAIIDNESQENIIKKLKYAKVIHDFDVIKKQYNYCNVIKKGSLESLKRDERRLMIRIIEENDWEKKQSLEKELSNIRKRIDGPVSNVFIKKTEARYNELIALQKKE